MKTNIVFANVIIFILLLISCNSSKNDKIDDYLSSQIPVNKRELKYAEKFSVTEYDKFILLHIDSFSGKENSNKYILSEDAEYIESLEKKYSNGNVSLIKIPVEKAVSLSSHNIAFLDALSLLERVKGIDSVTNIANTEIHNKVSEGCILEVGEGRNIDLETLKSINPGIVLTSGTGGEYDAGLMLEDYKAVFTYEWLEKTPLARSEWIKCTALFFGCREEGVKVFDSIEESYNTLKKKAAGSECGISVLPNMVYGDSWAVPGGRSFAANLFKDANIDYPWSDNDSEGSLFLDFESVLAEAKDADIWLVNSMNINSIDDIIKTDTRYRFFSAVKRGEVYNNNRYTGSHGNPYWEEGLLYPDRILSDLIKIFHPETENTNPFYFYKKLSPEQ